MCMLDQPAFRREKKFWGVKIVFAENEKIWKTIPISTITSKARWKKPWQWMTQGPHWKNSKKTKEPSQQKH